MDISFRGNIKGMSVLTPERTLVFGKLCLAKANLAAYAHGEYFALGRHLGKFGFSVMKKSTRTRLDNGTDRKKNSKKNRHMN